MSFKLIVLKILQQVSHQTVLFYLHVDFIIESFFACMLCCRSWRCIMALRSKWRFFQGWPFSGQVATFPGMCPSAALRTTTLPVVHVGIVHYFCSPAAYSPLTICPIPFFLLGTIAMHQMISIVLFLILVIIFTVTVFIYRWALARWFWYLTSNVQLHLKHILYVHKQKAETGEGVGRSVMEDRLGGHSDEQSGKGHEEHRQQTHTLSSKT